MTSESHATLTVDDRCAVAALDDHSVDVRAWLWTDPPDALPPDSVLVLRSVWDYHLRSDEFARWIDAVEARGHTVLNTPALVRWNLNKRYLAELQAAGVPIIPTSLVPRGSDVRLEAVAASLETTAVVVKPSVSASAFETHRLDLNADSRHALRVFNALRADHELLVQPYVPEIITDGEWSLIFFGGVYSHAVQKRPADGDFRVQTDFGGSFDSAQASSALVAAACSVVNALPGGIPPLYVRVDGVRVGDRFLLMEAECIDPVLFFGLSREAPALFAHALATDIRNRTRVPMS